MIRDRSAPSLGAVMVLTAASSFGLWAALPDLRSTFQVQDGWPIHVTVFEALQFAAFVLVGILGGLSLIGPPLLLRESRRDRRRWGPGKFLWFVLGTATWLMLPPILYGRSKSGIPAGGISKICYFYGTPLMALYVVTALLVGGRFRRTLRRRYGPSWRERFGIITALIWAAIGVGLLILFYKEDIFR